MIHLFISFYSLKVTNFNWNKFFRKFSVINVINIIIHMFSLFAQRKIVRYRDLIKDKTRSKTLIYN